jgi:hypothetical protein
MRVEGGAAERDDRRAERERAQPSVARDVAGVAEHGEERVGGSDVDAEPRGDLGEGEAFGGVGREEVEDRLARDRSHLDAAKAALAGVALSLVAAIGISCGGSSSSKTPAASATVRRQRFAQSVQTSLETGIFRPPPRASQRKEDPPA